jgi:hypothetical protein
MNIQSLFFTCVVAIVATALFLMSTRFLAKRQKINTESEGNTNLSYSIWNCSLIFPFFLFLKVALEQTENAIEVIIFTQSIDDTFMQVMQRIAIYTGFTFLFTYMTYYIVNIVMNITMNKRVERIEIEKNNVGYFIIKGIVMILLVFSLTTIFDHFLRWFAPVIETPFYH